MGDIDISSNTPQLNTGNIPLDAVAVPQKNLAAIREKDTLDSTPTTPQSKINNSSALAGAPEPLKRDNVSTKDVNHGTITGSSGFGNGWFSSNYIVAIAVATNEMQAINRDQLIAEAKQEILSMHMTYEYGQDAAAQIMSSARSEAAMHIVSAVMGGVSVAMGAGKALGAAGVIKLPENSAPRQRIAGLEKSLDGFEADKAVNSQNINKLGNTMRQDALGRKDPPGPMRDKADISKDLEANEANIKTQKEVLDNIKNDIKTEEAKPNPDPAEIDQLKDSQAVMEKNLGDLDVENKALNKELNEATALTPDADGNYPDSFEDLARNNPTHKTEADNLFDERKKLDFEIASTRRSINDAEGKMMETITAAFTAGEGVARIGEGVAKAQLTVEKGQADAMRSLIESAAQIRRQQMDKASRGVDDANSNAAKLSELMTNIYRSYTQSATFSIR